MLRSFNRSAPFLAALILSVGACQDESLMGPQSGQEIRQTVSAKGFTLLLTDAPGDFVAAVVTISKIYLQGQNGRVTLREDPWTGDLLTLRDSFATLVQGLELPPGSYSQLRLVVEDAYIEVETAGGTKVFASSPSYAGLPPGKSVDGDLHMPSFGSSGLKVDLPGGNLQIGEGQVVVLIDFDVAESFGHEAGKSGKWVMHPVVKATNVTFGGFVTVRLQLASGITLPMIGGQQITLANFTVRLTPVSGGNAIELPFSDADGDGVFEAMFKALLPGDYKLEFVLPSGLLVTFGTALPLTITVGENQTVTQTITVNTAQAAASLTATLALNAGVTLPAVGGNPTTLAQFRARLTPSAGGTPHEVAFTDANNDGTFEATFTNLAAGQYSLTVVAPTGVTATFNPVPPVTVDVAAGSTQTRAFTITAATSP
jgi:hypothetical protein